MRRYRDDELTATLPGRIAFGINREEATRFGLPCGGRLELQLERPDIATLQPLLEAMTEQRLLARHLALPGGEVILREASTELDFHHDERGVTRVFGPRWQMLLIGAGHLSHCLSQMAQLLDYRVIVCDPREEYTRGWQLEGTELTTLMPDDAVRHYTTHGRSVVIALTHDPRLDDMALIDALASPALYVGAIGSVRNCAARRERMREMGLSSSEIERLHAPVGLAIGSHTPPEIAVSILAEVTAERNTVIATNELRNRVAAV